MESDRFDDLVPGAYGNASRRRLVRFGLGALAVSALTTLSATADTVAKKKRKRRKKKKPLTPILPAATCPADLPVTCGNGCCSNTFPKCCVENYGPQQGEMLARAAGDSTCNPASFNCCPADQGGGSCGGRFPRCCPATTQRPFGFCADSAAVYCPSTAGGGACEAEFPKCCPGGDAQEPNRFSACCQASEACCAVTADCPTGQVCSNNCCQPAAAFRAVASRGVTSPRAGIRAR